MTNIIWHNGKWVNDQAPVFKISDRIRLGDGIFDTALITDNHAHDLDKHFSRLGDNAETLGLKPPFDLNTFETLASEITDQNNAQTGRFALNTFISRGVSQRGLKTPENTNHQTLLLLSPVPETFPDINAIIATKTRRNEGSPLSQIKSFNYGDNIIAMIEAENQGCNDAVLLNNKGHVSCTTMANIFIVQGADTITPPLSDGVLNGIARQLFMKRYACVEKSFTADELLNADSVFITNSLRGIQYIKTINGKEFKANPSLDFDKNFHITL